MTQYFNRRTLFICLAALIISLFVNGGLRILNVWLSPTENVLRNVIFATKVLQIGLLGFLIIQGIAQASTQKFSDAAPAFIAAGAVYILAAFLGGNIADAVSPSLKLRGYQAFLAENRVVIEAIELYVEEQGTPPNSLADLYPAYLAAPLATLPVESSGDEDAPTLLFAIPYDSIDAESAERVSYSYEFPASESEQWELAISLYLGSFKSVRFIYNQAQQYEVDFGRIDDWAYTGAY